MRVAHQRDSGVEQRPQQAGQDGRAGRDDGDERRLEQLVAVEGYIPAAAQPWYPRAGYSAAA